MSSITFLIKKVVLDMQTGFVRIELLIIMVILTLAATVAGFAFLHAKVEARDKIRLTDVAQIKKSIDIFFKENGYYPSSENGTPSGIANYLDYWPQAPHSDGACSDFENTYNYAQKLGGDDYTLSFCIGKKSGNLVRGPHIINSKGFN